MTISCCNDTGVGCRRRLFLRYASLTVWMLFFVLDATPAQERQQWTLINPTGRSYRDELVRIPLPIRNDFNASKGLVLQDGNPIPFQIEASDGKRHLWILTDLERDQTREYTIETIKQSPSSVPPPRVHIHNRQDTWVLDNGTIAVRIPAALKDKSLPPPVLQVRLPDGRWVGSGHWHVEQALRSFNATIVGDGTLFAKVRLEYSFEGLAGIEQVPSFYRAEITLAPGRSHIEIEESFEMKRHSYWEFAAAHAWAPQAALTIPHFGGFDREDRMRPDGTPYPFPPVSLHPGQTRMGDTLLKLIPRWSQSYDDGWLFLTHDNKQAVGAMVCRAGKWLWPHDNLIEIKVRDSVDYAGLRCPTRRGKRYWLLLAGAVEDWSNKKSCEAYVVRHSFEALDKLIGEYTLNWPGLTPPADTSGAPKGDPERYASAAGRFGARSRAFFGWGRVAGGNIAGDQHPLVSLIRAQLYLDPDTFGDYWRFYSSENPNFATSWWGSAFQEGAKCKDHPLFPRLVSMLEHKFKEDLYHSVTLPGGAGQECFGYMSIYSWMHRARFCKEHLGFDATQWPRLKAAAEFLVRTSQPLPDGYRRSHPGGDTHPPGPNIDGVARTFGVPLDPGSLVTEVFPGFGMVFRNRSGTPDETYLAFKSGPNRGHYHGDQLSFHYCAYARPLAVDHHCSYAPRAGQEHMHNRVAFHSEQLPWANMDGYERLIAFRTSPEADIAIGQVDSERLRITEPFPPEKWDARLPEQRFDQPLRYRRTIVMLKRPEGDCFVIRDQKDGPSLNATYCLHVLGDRCLPIGERGEHVYDFDGLRLWMFSPTPLQFSRHDWQHNNFGWEATKGLRLTTQGEKLEFISVLIPRPVKRLDVGILKLEQVFREQRDRQEAVEHDLSVRLAFNGNALASAEAFVTGVAFNRDFNSFRATAALQPDGSLGLKILGVRRQDEQIRFEGTLHLTEVNGDYLGNYRGTVWDAAAMKHIRQGGEHAGTTVEGVLSGKRERDMRAPVALFEESWQPPIVEALPNGVRVGDWEVTFSGAIDENPEVRYVQVKAPQEVLSTLTGKDIDLNRSQGEIGLFVPDAGYPFGEIPEWLIEQRYKRPDWYRKHWPLSEVEEK